jgi:hypothetical protein
MKENHVNPINHANHGSDSLSSSFITIISLQISDLMLRQKVLLHNILLYIQISLDLMQIRVYIMA